MCYTQAIDELVLYEVHYCSVLKSGVKVKYLTCEKYILTLHLQSYKEPITVSKVIPSSQMQNIFANIDEVVVIDIVNGSHSLHYSCTRFPKESVLC